MFKNNILLVIGLIFLLCFIRNQELYSFVNFIILFCILKWIIKDNYITLLIALFVTILIYACHPAELYENFEAEEAEEAEESEEAEAEEGEGKEAATNSSSDEIKEEDDIFDNEDYAEEESTGNKVPKKNDPSEDNYMTNMTPAKAQRETFRLIDTMKQLDDTMKSLAPTLKQGQGILERFKKLDLIKVQ